MALFLLGLGLIDGFLQGPDVAGCSFFDSTLGLGQLTYFSTDTCLAMVITPD